MPQFINAFAEAATVVAFNGARAGAEGPAETTIVVTSDKMERNNWELMH